MADDIVVTTQAMVNEKFRENVPAWNGFDGPADKFAAFFKRVLALRQNSGSWQTHERVIYPLLFLTHAGGIPAVQIREELLQLFVSVLLLSCGRR